MKKLTFGLILLSFLAISCRNSIHKDPKEINYCDAHVHLTTYGESSIDSLYKYGIKVARDCGGDLTLLIKWRDEINSGTRKGPRIYIAGPVVDGREEGSVRIGVTNPEQARRVTDSLTLLGVDFIKTHSTLAPECYFAVLREAHKRNIKVVSHLPQEVPVWIAADSGVSCIEHAAESFLGSPVGAGYIKATGDDAIFAAIDWWRSPSGDSVINHLGKFNLFFTPTLYSYKVWSMQGTSNDEIDSRLKVLDFLKELTFKLHNAGVIILAGTDLYDTTWQNETPGKSLFDEIRMLQEAGLTKQEATDAATINFQKWIKSKSD